MINTMQRGAPCWLDLGSPDVAASAAFYEGVFGWQWEPVGGAELASFGLLRHGGGLVGGIGALDDGARSAWIVYFRAPDVAETARTARERGGSVRVEPFEAIEGEPMAQLTDPSGAEFAIRQAPTEDNVVTVSEPGTLIWCELYTTDSASAKDFYRALFGWRVSDMAMPSGGESVEPGGGASTADPPDLTPTVYSVVVAEGDSGPDEGLGGIVEVGSDRLPTGHAYWNPVFHVTDCDATAASVNERGGLVTMGPESVEGVGRVAVCTDPFGAPFALLHPGGG